MRLAHRGARLRDLEPSTAVFASDTCPQARNDPWQRLPAEAPELARYDQIHAERRGGPAPATPPAPAGTALGALSEVLGRDGQQLSATQTRQQALADADHLALLHAIWTAETTPASQQHYRDLLMNTLPPGHRREPGHQARWLT